MATAYVLVKTSPGYAREVHHKSYYFPEICESHPLFGEYDLITRIEAKDFDELGEIVLNKIRAVDGVADTKTLTASKF